jgi:glycosyltransferase involved in cell wall biosynthesis
MRFVWDYNDKYLKETKNKKMSFLARIFFNYARIWDRLAADRPDFLIANSVYTQQRIKKYYRRESTVIYPPVMLEPKTQNPESDTVNHSLLTTNYFLVVSRLSPYKKVDVVVDAFNKLGLPLVIIGEGEQAKYLKSIAKDNIKFLNWQNDQVIEKYYQNAQGFIFPVEDDFGIAPVEAMLAGVPVLAYRKGGALETVEEGVTGEFFDAQTPEVLADGVRRLMLNKKNYSSELIRKKGEEFSKEKFLSEIKKCIQHVQAESGC